MKKTLTALVAAVTVLGAVAASTGEAEARRGGAVAAGVIGGLAAGAIIGSAAGGYYGPGPYYGYGPAPVYYGPGCYWTRERFWDGYGYRSRRVRVCG